LLAGTNSTLARLTQRLEPLWHNAIEPAIADAGYTPKRIDKHEHNNRIDDEIIATIRRSRFVIADYTGNRGGVYFEAGFALGLGIPVIWTCRDGRLNKVHFDTRQYNFITRADDKLPDFRNRLNNRICATII
jgi:nucleoside 2-deoxyribosyltransferase